MGLIVVGQGSPAFAARRVGEEAVDKDGPIPVLVLARGVGMGCYLEAMQLGDFDNLEIPLSASRVLKLVATHVRDQNKLARRVSQCRSLYGWRSAACWGAWE
jgi:DNA-binding NtrC family response regulator